MKKLIVSDIDGTLVHKGGLISQKNIDVIKELQQKGHYFTIASGRSTVLMAKYFNDLKIDIPVISSNGAFIGNPVTGEDIFLSEISRAAVKEVVDICMENETPFLVYTNKCVMALEKVRLMFLERINEKNNDDLAFYNYIDGMLDEDHHFLKVLVIQKDPEKYGILRDKFKDVNGVHVTQSSETFIDVGKEGVNKGEAVKVLAKHLNVPLEHVYTFGDQSNDIDMIKVAGNGVAMGNAVESLKKEADFITLSCELDGFAEFVGKNIL